MGFGARLIRSLATKFCMIGWRHGHNLGVAARSLLRVESNLGLPRDFDELRVAEISRLATSALTAANRPLYRMGRAY